MGPAQTSTVVVSQSFALGERVCISVGVDCWLRRRAARPRSDPPDSTTLGETVKKPVESS